MREEGKKDQYQPVFLLIPAWLNITSLLRVHHQAKNTPAK